MKFKGFTLVFVVALLAILAVSVSAQDMAAPTVTVVDQISLNATVDVASVWSEGPGWVVIHNSEGPGIGQAAVAAGWTYNLRIPITTPDATSTLSAMLHVDDGEVGTYEFGTVEGADAPVLVGDAPVNPTFVAQIIHAHDQFIVDNQYTTTSVTIDVPGWLVIHADDNGTFGGVLGQTQIPAGTTAGVVVDLPEDRTEVIWPMLHVDTGTEGEYEFGTVEGADSPVVVNGTVASLPVWTVPHLRVNDQIAVLGDGMEAGAAAPSIVVDSVLSEGPGIVVIHANDNGNAGTILGAAFVPEGLGHGPTGVTIELDPSAGITPIVWPMLHTDGGDIGTYVDNEVDPPVSVADGVVTFTSNAAPALVMADQAAVDGTITIKNALIDAPGWLALHSDNEGAPGPVVATAQLHRGANWNVKLTLPEGTAAGTTFFPMLHYDTGEAGVYEFGTVEGADAPVFVGGNVIVAPLVVTE
jgi:hypothetical protein